MIDGVPIGAVCPFAGQIHPVTGDANNIWAATTCSSQNSQAGDLNPNIPLTYPESFGWMLCDGRSLPKAAYPELFAVLGTLYGGTSDSFRIPDYRGLFLRGVDAGAGMDPDAAKRIGPAGTGAGGGIGSLQCDALQEHKHSYRAVTLTTPTGSGNAGGQTAAFEQTTVPDPPARLSVETRPKNIAVNYIIKYR
jgi:microcystin-dependent protein